MEYLAFVCRVCLETNAESKVNSLYDEVEYEEYVKLTTVFRKVTTIEIPEAEDVRPTHLCHECTERLLSAYEFICAVERAEQDMDNYVNKVAGFDNDGDLSELPDVEEQLEDIEVEDTAEVDMHDVEEEVLEEEFIADHDLVDVSITTNEELILEEQQIVEHTPEFDDESNNLLFNDVTEERTAPSLVGSRLLKRQTKTNNYHKCDSCQRSFAKIETLERHIKVAHTIVSTSSPEATNNETADEKKIACPHCPQCFKRRNNYVRHLITCHSKEAENLTPEDRDLAKTKHNYKRGVCPHCGESFTQASLIIHIRRHTGENPYQCDECDRAFPRRQDLNIHKVRHTGEKPHVCSVCNKSFSRANKLSRHMRIHTGERPYKCTLCERSFTQSNDLKIHMRRHTGEKPYKCSVCSQAFICGAALKTHRKQKNHHTPEDELDDPFASWRVCKRQAKTQNTQKLHDVKEDYSEEQFESMLDDNFKTIDGEVKIEMEISQH